MNWNSKEWSQINKKRSFCSITKKRQRNGKETAVEITQKKSKHGNAACVDEGQTQHQIRQLIKFILNTIQTLSECENQFQELFNTDLTQTEI